MAYRGSKRFFQVSFIRVSIMTEMKLIYIVAGNLNIISWRTFVHVTRIYFVLGVLYLTKVICTLNLVTESNDNRC